MAEFKDPITSDTIHIARWRVEAFRRHSEGGTRIFLSSGNTVHVAEEPDEVLSKLPQMWGQG